MTFFQKDGKLRTKILFIIGMMLAGIAAVITLSLFTMKRELFEDRISGNGADARPALPVAPQLVKELGPVQTARPRKPRAEMVYAHAGGRARGVQLDRGTHGQGNGKNGDSKDAEFEAF